QQFAHGDAEGLFDDAAVLDVAGELDGQRAARTTHAVIAVVLGALVQNDRHRSERDDVVDHRRLAEQTFDRGNRRLVAHFAALAFQAFQQRGLFAADISPRAHAYFQFELLARTENVVAEVALGFRHFDRAVERGMRVGIFGAQIDVALRRAAGDTGDGHAFDEHEGIAF